MYYLHAKGRGARPTPAESPCLCGPDGLHEWRYAQEKHKSAVQHVKGLVDFSVPKCVNPDVERVHVATRKFFQDQKHAEIGRENRKLVERLNTIARGAETGYDPRSPPRESNGLSKAIVYKKGKSLTESGRRQTQHTIDENNAALVRRILQTKGTFDRMADELDFEKHQRAGHALQRLPGGEMPRARSCPKLVSSASVARLQPLRGGLVLQGLDMLLIPGELRRGGTYFGGPPQTLALSDGVVPKRQESPGLRQDSRGRSSDGASRSRWGSSRSSSRSRSTSQTPDSTTDKAHSSMQKRVRHAQSSSREGSADTLDSPQRTRSQLGNTGCSTHSSMKYGSDAFDDEDMSQSESMQRPPAT